MPGRFVVIEGLDGVGTTTQAARLVAWLRARGLEAVGTHEPTGGPVGKLIRSTLRRGEGAPARETLPWLFAADRADHLHRLVQPTLGAGGWVVSDRYYHSSLAYQSLDHPMTLVDELNRHFLVPDLTIFLSLPVEACLARIVKRREELEIFEEHAVLAATAARYHAVIDLLRARGQRIIELSGEGSIEEVAEEVAAVVEQALL